MPRTQRSRSSSKYSVVAIVSDHYRTLYKFSSDDQSRVNWVEVCFFIGSPLLAASLVWWKKAGIQNVPEILSAVAILTGLTFNVFVLLFDMTMRALDKPSNTVNGPSRLDVANELRANVSYAVLIGLSMSAILGGLAMFTDTSKQLGMAWSCLIVFLGVQLLLTLSMCLKRARSMFRILTKDDSERLP